MSSYVPLWCKTNFSFLQGASHPDELIEEAQRLGLRSIAVTDRDGVYGMVRAYVKSKELGMQLIAGAQVTVAAPGVEVNAVKVMAGGQRSSGGLHSNDHHDDNEYVGAGPGWGEHSDEPEPPVVVGYRRGRAVSRSRKSGASSKKSGRGNHDAQLRMGVADRSVDKQVRTAAETSQLVLLASNRQGWAQITRLLTLGRRRSEKGSSLVNWAEVCSHAEGVIALWGGEHSLLLDDAEQPAIQVGGALREAFGDRLYAMATRHKHAEDARRELRLRTRARTLRIPVVAATEVLYHTRARRQLQDVLACIRAGVTLATAGRVIKGNDEYDLKAPVVFDRLWADSAGEVARTLEIASRCQFSLAELRYRYPSERLPDGRTSAEHLRMLTWDGARQRYAVANGGDGSVPADVARQLTVELGLIEELDYPGYFLTMYEIVSYCKRRDILCQGRGSAANSAVCYCLGITAVDPVRMGLLFERFLSRERAEPPDIDLDIEHERREEVIQHVYHVYGRDHAAMVCNVIRYRAKSAVRDVGKVLGIPETALDRAAKLMSMWGGDVEADALEAAGLAAESPRGSLHDQHHQVSPDRYSDTSPRDQVSPDRYSDTSPRDQVSPDRYSDMGGGLFQKSPSAALNSNAAGQCHASPASVAVAQKKGPALLQENLLMVAAGNKMTASAAAQLAQLAGEIIEFPRHLSVHPGGFLLGHEPVHDLVPIENATMADRTVIQWDKDDLEDLGLFKVDLLGLGALHHVHLCLDLLRKHHGIDLSMATIPAEDPATYDLMCTADTIGVFQIESRAQMSMLPRLRPRTFYDLVVEISLVRPGPISGGMVHPYLRRRRGEETVEYPHPCLEPVLAKTLGVPLFQEQVMKLAVVAADYTPGEADQLRRDMAAWRRSGRIEKHRDRLISRMEQKGIAREFGERVFEQIRGFGEYGFPESHAASFALIAYATSWLRCHYMAEFTCALLNAYPMGFYSPSTIVGDAQRHGVTVLPIDVDVSSWECTLTKDFRSDQARQTEREVSLPLSIQMGLRWVKGLTTQDAARIADARALRPFADVEDFVRRTHLSTKAHTALAESGALSRLTSTRRDALWQTAGWAVRQRDSFSLGGDVGQRTAFAGLSKFDEILWDHRSSDHSPRGHPLGPLRAELTQQRIPDARTVAKLRDGQRLQYVGMVICRQRPATASGVTFMTLEDETGFVNVVVWAQIFAQHSVVARTASLLGVTGRLQVQEGIVHLVTESLWIPALSRPIDIMASRDFH
jgi:DNA polymerase III alpha subunit